MGRVVLEGVFCVLYECIYCYVWEDKKKGGCLYLYLCNKGKRYRKRGVLKDKWGVIIGRVFIEERFDIVEEKGCFGDLEIDMIVGKDRKGVILMINDRVMGMVKICKLEGKYVDKLVEMVNDVFKEWKLYLYIIIVDNGKEFVVYRMMS